MTLSISPADFFTALHASGIAGVTREALSGADGERVLKRVFDEAIEDLPGDATELPWQPQVAAEALQYFYRLCQALVDRAMTDEQVTALCATVPAPSNAPGDVLAADLTLRHLPELYGMAKSMSSGDPLVKGIEEAARRFPLSSVGIALKEPLPDISALQRHAGLWQLYIDRVIERQDVSRLADEHVRLAVADALGEHARQLAPKLAAALALASVPSLTPHEPNPPAIS